MSELEYLARYLYQRIIKAMWTQYIPNGSTYLNKLMRSVKHFASIFAELWPLYPLPLSLSTGLSTQISQILHIHYHRTELDNSTFMWKTDTRLVVVWYYSLIVCLEMEGSA